ncbi:GATA zinc finger protein [Komagataella phaffii CBS 7435]|uniref:GATA-type domain-containing protein n=2 Tax=Komagataella phaffii TaxID=460519 RepID=C4QXM5_KOMPG|nr:uncharacterized protein PAS_chr1-4_0658 [Komagataella phaffii GS115]AOA61214.1 GQ67_02018T0 [Komagataella phaffii]CAH2446812.1 GATA zinc finger protein [Komagataella phaffii CBS 7435]AOA65713.1 GQ68_02033T0 [Komagataella phaffii GS115]CAY67998.1 hypothetical protein PAS_chr1-4_0658 [Komagataella phaffii GS115]CCA37072.1 GATA zinc finger protein [Komagataella phaffii CBS 7435]
MMDTVDTMPANDLAHDPIHPNAKTTITTNTNDGTSTSKTNISSPVCRNCKTQTTPLWRRDETGQVLCNACGLFLKLHGRPRPISLKTDVIKSRNRVKHNHSGSNNNNNSSSNNNSNNNSGSSSNSTSSNVDTEDDLKDKKFSSKAFKIKKEKDKDRDTIAKSASANNSPGLIPLLPRDNAGCQPNPTSSNSGNLMKFQLLYQPMSRPNSTPTHFAPNLNAVTSPLLLTTTSSERSSLGKNNNGLALVNAAAGALETMSNESNDNDKKIPKMKLDDDETKLKESQSNTTTPASLLKRQFTPSIDLPSISANSKLNSPTFGPQFSLSAYSSTNSSGNGTGNGNGSAFSSAMEKSSSIPSFNSLKPLMNNSNNHSQSNNVPSSLSRSSTGSHTSDDPVELRTRISELELVNDLYRTRIQELEAMESAARQREQLLTKRLNELKGLPSEGGVIDNETKRVKLENGYVKK